jgi:hypothetical protein
MTTRTTGREKLIERVRSNSLAFITAGSSPAVALPSGAGRHNDKRMRLSLRGAFLLSGTSAVSLIFIRLAIGPKVHVARDRSQSLWAVNIAQRYHGPTTLAASCASWVASVRKGSESDIGLRVTRVAFGGEPPKYGAVDQAAIE